jgi:type VI secretion system protein ImpA
MDVEELTELQTITNSLKESLTAIEAILTERVGPDKTPDFGTLMEIITEADDFYAHQLSLKQPVGMLSGLKQSLSGKKRRKTPPTSEETAIKARETPMESINSRQDVIRLLDQICVFYAQNEPASPVPLLLQRARTLVEKNFYEIMEDLAPKTATELKKLIGEPGNE